MISAFVRRTSLILGLITAGCGPGSSPGRFWIFDAKPSASPRADQQLRDKLARTTVDVDFKNEPLEKVFESLRARNGLNIEPDWKLLESCGIGKDKAIALQLKQVSLGNALENILDRAGAGTCEPHYKLDRGIVRISTMEGLNTEAYVRVYNVADLAREEFLMRVLDDYPLSPKAAPGNGSRPAYFNESLDGADALVDLILTTIAPRSWNTAGGTDSTIRAYGPLIIVRQSAQVHREIETLLATIRRALVGG
jgi:hypothetical protein